MMNIILASASPRRLELMRLISQDFEVKPAGIDEVVPPDISAPDCPEYIARLKVQSIACDTPNKLIIGCDTAVIIDGEVLGKPKDYGDAQMMLHKLSGREHTVVTGCCLCFNDKNLSFSEKTSVLFYELSDDEIDDYIRTGEPFDKAGGYGIQGVGALLVKSIAGDYFNVVGMPVSRLSREIRKFSL